MRTRLGKTTEGQEIELFDFVRIVTRARDDAKEDPRTIRKKKDLLPLHSSLNVCTQPLKTLVQTVTACGTCRLMMRKVAKRVHVRNSRCITQRGERKEKLA